MKKTTKPEIKIHEYYLSKGQYARYYMPDKPIYVVPMAGSPVDILTEGEEVLVPTFVFEASGWKKEIARLVKSSRSGFTHVSMPIRDQQYRNGKLWRLEAGLVLSRRPLKFSLDDNPSL